MQTNPFNDRSEVLWKKYFTLAAVWSVLVMGSLGWVIYQEQQSTLRTATAAALANINKDISFRKWANSHGGVYVPPTEHTPPNPYLKIPDRDVTTSSGKTLTLMNPAYILREIQTDFSGDYGYKSHITSLKPLNPNNAPDDWEVSALHGFERGEKELLEIQQIDGQPYLRLMRPFLVDNGCLKCHAQQGYKVGDIRGGISAAVPMQPYLTVERQLNIKMLSTHGMIWLLGLVGLGVSHRRDRRHSDQRRQAEEELTRFKNKLEEEVQQRTTDLVLARNAAEAANKAKSVFLANMSHELRTPLNAILGFSNMMRKDTQLPERQRQNLDIINRSGEHLLVLINDVLEMAKIEAGRVLLESAAFDLGGMVRDVTDMMQVRAAEKGLRLQVDQSSRFPRYMLGDEARLRQILINLLSNAVKFTWQGEVTLRLGVHKNQTSRLLIEVEDTGVGIAQEDRQRIFEPFVQLGDHRDSKGTGLGLSITRQFVQLMGGRIELQSTPGKGSLFRVDLPLNEARNAADSVLAKQAEKGDVLGLAPGQPAYRILIVEDQLENQLLLRKLMESVGFLVRVAEDGKQGVALFQSWRPHLIWMDRHMPGMDGIEATQRIRALPGGKSVKIVAVTASAFMEQRDEMLDAGMDDFVRKPYRFNEIYECLAKQLNVQYTYAGAPDGEEKPSGAALSTEMLMVLPPELRKQLCEALETLETERINAVIQQVANYDPGLQRMLEQLADNFDYPAILKALRTVLSNNG